MIKGILKNCVRPLIPLVDFLLTPFIYLSGKLLYLIRKYGFSRFPHAKSVLLSIGVCPIIDHYYEPLFHPRNLRYSLKDKRNLPGIDWNVDAQIALLKSFHYEEELLAIPLESESENSMPTYYYNNHTYESGDGDFLYCMIRHFKPHHIIEVGSGFSTLASIMAIEKNMQEDQDYHCLHECIEPYENSWLEKVPAQIIRKKLEDVDPKIFGQLEENDMLIIDSSHMIRPQGDVLLEYLEILPSLPKGVLVHIHDIFSPKDYPDEWIKGVIYFWNEQYLLEAFLTNNSNYEIVAASNYLMHNHYDLISEKFPILKLQPDREPGCFWIRKK